MVFIREKEKSAAAQAAPPPQPKEGATVKSLLHDYKVETVIEGGLQTPWSLAFLPDGRQLVTERPGSLRMVDTHLLPEPISGTPTVIELGQGGLLDVAPSLTSRTMVGFTWRLRIPRWREKERHAQNRPRPNP